jgi:hypothetical protein
MTGRNAFMYAAECLATRRAAAVANTPVDCAARDRRRTADERSYSASTKQRSSFRNQFKDKERHGTST